MTSGGGLRDFSFVGRSWLRSHRWRLVPLILLLVAAIVAAVAGLAWRGQQSPLGEGVIEPTAAPGAGLDREVCAPEVEEPDADPWSGVQADESEAVWQAHAAELGAYWVAGDDGHALLGEPHWSNLSQAVGRTELAPEHIRAWEGYLGNMRADLAAQGRELYIVVAPAKWQIVPEALPDWMEQLRAPSDFTQLQAALPDLPWIDVRATMLAEQQETPLYAPLNSHWTDYGAATAFGQIAACLRASDPALATMPELPIEGASAVADRNEFAGFGLTTPPGMDWTVPVWTHPPADMTVRGPDGAEREADAATSITMEQLPSATSTSGAPVDQHVLIVRDSTGDQLAPMFQTTFQETTQIRSSLEAPAGMPDVAAEAEAAGADLVVLVITQRYLQVVPGVERE